MNPEIDKTNRVLEIKAKVIKERMDNLEEKLNHDEGGVRGIMRYNLYKKRYGEMRNRLNIVNIT